MDTDTPHIYIISINKFVVRLFRCVQHQIGMRYVSILIHSEAEQLFRTSVSLQSNSVKLKR